MLRDFKFLGRNSGKNEEIENVPVNTRDSLMSQASNDSAASTSLSRAPLNSIQDPSTNPKQERDSRMKIERTPTKPRYKNPDPALPLRTPDRHKSASFLKHRFGWGEKGDSSSNTNVGSFNMTPKTTKVVGRANSGHSEINSTHNTPAKSVSKPPTSVCRGKVDGAGSARPGGYASLYKGVSSSSGQVTVVNTVQVPHFDVKEDPSFWMDHNVQTLIRVRPLNTMEKSTNGYNRCLKQESSQIITWIGQPETRFIFDQVACETIDQENLFRVAGLPMVENCLSGYNSCIFAYGQTGSGKTYTMLGEVDDLDVKPSLHRGMMPRIFEFLFARIQAEEESRRNERLKYSCKCSFLEIYNEQITDLLDPSSTNLQLREDMKKGVYVENLTEYEVESVEDILKLISRGSLNRRVGATNMNRESSRSHSVFTCVIESTWEKDSATNLRFARLNLVDLAGSERQKTSGAEGDRLKEAASINKSLSTLGHVIMVLVDVANGRPRHIPYRDSRLTFLLQDSLGGNSKTMIIANVSPSICCAAETLNTLKFAQRAKLIQNNAVINEDSTGDVMALQHEIQILKDELSLLKRQNVSRALSFGSATKDVAEVQMDSGSSMRMSRKQLKSLETTLAGALRREQMADASIKKLEAEVEQLNRLARQREDDTRSTKMMLKFREDKIQRMEALLGNHISEDSFLQEENRVLSEEIELLHAKIDKSPELTRFALENIRLLDQLRRFQEFYEEGEREILLAEVSNLREQLLQSLDGNSDWHEQPEIQPQLKNTLDDLEECRSHLGTCLEENSKLKREIKGLEAMISEIKACGHEDKESKTIQAPFETRYTELQEAFASQQISHVEEIIKLQLDLDILNIILDEERMMRREAEKQAIHFKQNLEELVEAKSVIEALESQNIILIQETEESRKKMDQFDELTRKQELEITSLKAKQCNELKDNPRKGYEKDTKFEKIQKSLEKAMKLNIKNSGEEDMDEVHKQAEAAAAEVIVCLQNELDVLQKEAEESLSKETEAKRQVMLLQAQMEEMKDKVEDMSEDNNMLQGKLHEKAHEMELLTSELEEILLNGNEALNDACSQIDVISGSFPEKRIWISEQVGALARSICEKELIIDDLRNCLEDANNRRYEVESMVKSLRGASLVINEAQQRENRDKERQIQLLESQICTNTDTISRLREKLYETSHSATAAFVIVGRYSEVLKQKDLQLHESARAILSLTKQVEDLEANCNEFRTNLLEAEKKLENIEESEMLRMEGRLSELKDGISGVRSCMNMSQEPNSDYEEEDSGASPADYSVGQELRKDVFVCSCIEKTPPRNDQMKSIKDSRKVGSKRDRMILILKKELESSLESLKEVKYEMAKLQNEKEELELSKVRSIDNLKDLTDQFLHLEQAMSHMEEQYKNNMEVTDHKLKSLEHELAEIKILAGQEDARNLCILTKFEEAQGVIKEADIMINELVLMNEKMKRDLEREKRKEIALVNEVQEKESVIVHEKQRSEKLEKQFELSLMETKSLIDDLEAVVRKLQDDSSKDLIDIGCSFADIEYWIAETRSARLLLEEIWSEIITKDCAFSVLQLCNMGILLETVTGINTEKSLLHHGLSESNSAIAELRDNNMKLRKELEMCRNLRGKLLVDIKNSFERISRKEEETNHIRSRFEQKISCLQHQEELMLQRSDSLDSQISILMKELDRELHRKEKDEFYDNAMQLCLMEFCSKDVESLVLALTLEEHSSSLLQHHEEFEILKDKLFVFEVEKNLEELCNVELLSDNTHLRNEILRKDEVLKGLSFDLSLLQESASVSRDQKDEIEQILDHLEATEEKLASKLRELDDAVNHTRKLEVQLQLNKEVICDLQKEREYQRILFRENKELRAKAEDHLMERKSLEEKLIQTNHVSESFENELVELNNALGHMNEMVESTRSQLKKTSDEKDSLEEEILHLKDELEKVKAEAEEAEEMAESRRIYADEREEEVKLLEGSVEELEYTVNVLENQVNVIKDEAERQRLQREEVESEFHTIDQQMRSVKTANADLKRLLDVKQKDLEAASKHIEMLERNLSDHKTEIDQLKTHISELILHAEAQASEYKHKLKELEMMSEQTKAESHVSHASSSSSSRNSTKPRGSGSPFRCIGLGISQQAKSEKDEELNAARIRIEELESEAAMRQKEIFALNARLATVGSMTHDVMRDLLGVKLNVTNYASLLDDLQVLKTAEKLQNDHSASHEKDMEISKLKQQLDEYIEEKQEWMKEIERKQAELVAVEIELEKHCRHEQMLKKENELLKSENVSHKRKVMELEEETKKKKKKNDFQTAGVTEHVSNRNPKAVESELQNSRFKSKSKRTRNRRETMSSPRSSWTDESTRMSHLSALDR